jgi:hypothetical protein
MQPCTKTRLRDGSIDEVRHGNNVGDGQVFIDLVHFLANNGGDTSHVEFAAHDHFGSPKWRLIEWNVHHGAGVLAAGHIADVSHDANNLPRTPGLGGKLKKSCLPMGSSFAKKR